MTAVFRPARSFAPEFLDQVLDEHPCCQAIDAFVASMRGLGQEPIADTVRQHAALAELTPPAAELLIALVDRRTAGPREGARAER